MNDEGKISTEPQQPGERYSHSNRGTLGQTWPGTQRLNLSAEQLDDHEDDPSRKAPREGHGVSRAASITLVIAAGVALLIVLWAAGVIF